MSSFIIGSHRSFYSLSIINVERRFSLFNFRNSETKRTYDAADYLWVRTVDKTGAPRTTTNRRRHLVVIVVVVIIAQLSSYEVNNNTAPCHWQSSREVPPTTRKNKRKLLTSASVLPQHESRSTGKLPIRFFSQRDTIIHAPVRPREKLDCILWKANQ